MEAKIKLIGQDVFQPLETPKELWNYTPELMHRLARQAQAYGFPFMGHDILLRIIFLRFEDRLVNVAFSLPPSPTVVSIGNQMEPSFYLFLQTGIIQWNKKIPVAILDQASKDYDEYMAGRGLFDPQTGQRKSIIYDGHKFAVEDVFADPSLAYAMDERWDMEVVKNLFDRPEALMVIQGSDGRRHLMLEEFALRRFHGRTIVAIKSNLEEGELLQRIADQYDDRRYS